VLDSAEYGELREVRRVRNRDSCPMLSHGNEYNASSSLQMTKKDRSSLKSMPDLILGTSQSHSSATM
jgi:hypothetical protein